MTNKWLVLAGVLDVLAAIAHLACLIGGPAYYRFLGAGERIVRLAEHHSARPAIMAIGIAAMLGLWSALAFSGAGLLIRLPWLRPALLAVTAIYLVRAAALPVLWRMLPDRSPSFLVWSSAIVLVIGIVHAAGLVSGWDRLG